MQHYSIGTPGKPWGEGEKLQWKAKQVVQRKYREEVLDRLERVVPDGFSQLAYGALPYDESRYPLYAVVPVEFNDAKPTALVTGGVHGYETSGVQGALQFIDTRLAHYSERINVIVVPCVSPWGYETVNRWNPMAIDPNRSFFADSPSPEAAQLMQFVDSLNLPFVLHIDLHETTDTDNSEFRPALAARDGVTHNNWNIPDGFYTVANTSSPEIEFQQSVIEAVRSVTHIAPPDKNGKIIGADVISDGVICYDKKSLFLCGGMTDAKYVTTTEVYPDSRNATPEICNDAQVSAICAALDFIK